MSDHEEEKKEEIKEDCSNPDVVTKYRAAGDIANAALALVVSLCKAGAKIVDVCEAGDQSIKDATSKIYRNKKKMDKGVGFPTCVSVNNVVGHFCPLKDDESVLAEGDVAKLDLGCNIDGYIAQASTTIVVGAEGPADGVKGDLLAAVYTASEAAIRMLKINGKNTAITEAFATIADSFGVKCMHGVLSHQLNRLVIDGPKTIICKADTNEKVEEVVFEPNEAYAVDIVMTTKTGSGKPEENKEMTNVYKRNVNETYNLKMKASKRVFSEFSQKYPTFPFTTRSLESTAAKFGLKECIEHNLVTPYPVLIEKAGAFVAHVKFTALLLPNGTIKVCGPTITPDQFTTEKKIEDAGLVALLATSANKKKKKKKNNKKKKKAAAAE